MSFPDPPTNNPTLTKISFSKDGGLQGMDERARRSRPTFTGQRVSKGEEEEKEERGIVKGFKRLV